MRYFVVRDGKIEASAATKEAALDIVRRYQKMEREMHQFLLAQFSIIEGTEEHVPYE